MPIFNNGRLLFGKLETKYLKNPDIYGVSEAVFLPLSFVERKRFRGFLKLKQFEVFKSLNAVHGGASITMPDQTDTGAAVWTCAEIKHVLFLLLLLESVIAPVNIQQVRLDLTIP
jgi:hypothetical protein